MKRTRQLVKDFTSNLRDPIALHSRPSICIFCQYQCPNDIATTRTKPSLTTVRYHSRNSKFLRPRNGSRLSLESTPASSVDLNPSPHGEFAVMDDLGHEDYNFIDESQARQDAQHYAEKLRRRQRAGWQAQVDDAPMHNDYVPAKTWDGLELVGGEKEWDTGRRFKSFLGSTRLRSPEEITIAIYRATVEVFAALGVGRTPRTSQNYEVGPLVNEALQVKMEHTQMHDPEGPGKVRLSYPSIAVERAVLKAGCLPTNFISNLGSEDDLTVPVDYSDPGELASEHKFGDLVKCTNEVDSSGRAPHDLSQLIRSLGHSWHHISIQDPKTKFAVAKRITRLTGMHIPDHTLHKARTVSWFLQLLPKDHQSQKLFDSLSTDRKLAGLPNVRLVGRRETPIDRETQVGRWKVIEAELQRRDLPVVGRG